MAKLQNNTHRMNRTDFKKRWETSSALARLGRTHRQPYPPLPASKKPCRETWSSCSPQRRISSCVGMSGPTRGMYSRRHDPLMSRTRWPDPRPQTGDFYTRAGLTLSAEDLDQAKGERAPATRETGREHAKHHIASKPKRRSDAKRKGSRLHSCSNERDNARDVPEDKDEG